VITAVNAVIAGFAAGVKDYTGLVELCRTHANGTLLDDNHAVLTGVNTVCARSGRASVTLDEWRAIFDRPLVRSYERLLGQPLSPEEWAAVERLFHDAYRELLPSCRLANGVPDVLHQWQAIGRSQSLLSMAFHTELMELLVALGLVELFARVDGLRDAVGGGSKAGHLAQHVAALGLDPADVVLIGDVVDDALAAAHVGTACVLVSTGMMTRGALESTGALVVDSLHEALDVLSDNRVA
jgi:phosphoglycolate phosphatase-like HAD superfamily hydrolase